MLGSRLILEFPLVLLLFIFFYTIFESVMLVVFGEFGAFSVNFVCQDTTLYTKIEARSRHQSLLPAVETQILQHSGQSSCVARVGVLSFSKTRPCRLSTIYYSEWTFITTTVFQSAKTHVRQTSFCSFSQCRPRLF